MNRLRKLFSAAVLVLGAAIVLWLTGVGRPAKASPLESNADQQQPYTLSFYCNSDTTGECSAMPKVPRGKRFVIEYVSARVLVTTGFSPTYLQIGTWDHLVPYDPAANPFKQRSIGVPLTFAFAGSDGDYYSASEKVLIVAEPYTNPSNPALTLPMVSVGHAGNKIILYGVLTGYLESQDQD